ncbi:lipoprotein signal peptidase [Neisseria sp. N95_16]|nr:MULTISPECIES: lipoprotein signal peptidase [unclassified Neisseria]PJO08725.1 lipoprotein signal peptidase [Neisseria sp. N95_16]PJO77220.1 lipoprotein signal peptidase [Neisseria sp. N177_16]
MIKAETFANPYLWHISSLCAARKLAYLYDMSALSALLYNFELYSNLGFCKGLRPSENIFFRRPFCYYAILIP